MPRDMDHFAKLPVDCISEIISFTSPLDASVLSVISKRFMTASQSDTVWNKFLPSDLEDIISRSSSIPVFSTKRDLYLSLSDSPIILDGGKLSFSLDRKTGKKCFMVAARELTFAGMHGSRCLISLPVLCSRFTEVAVIDYLLGGMCDILVKISREMLSEETHYSYNLVYNVISPPKYWCFRIMREGGCRWVDNDWWLEAEIGRFFNPKGNEGELESQAFPEWSVVIIQGIEFRPTGIIGRENCLDELLNNKMHGVMGVIIPDLPK